MIHFRSEIKLDKEALVLFLTQDQVREGVWKAGMPSGAGRQVVDEVIAAGRFAGKAEDMFPVVAAGDVILLVGLGKEKDLTLTEVRMAVRRALLSAYLKDVVALEMRPHQAEERVEQAVIEGALIGSYRWTKYKRDAEAGKERKRRIFLIGKKREVHEQTISICEGVNLTRDLVNENADEVTAVFVERLVRRLIKGRPEVRLESLDEKKMKDEGLGLHLAVNKGSRHEPRLLIVRYTGGSAKDPYTALVGKGMTYDTGGLNLKPSGSIETMRMDMSGSAAVVGVLRNILTIRPKKNIVFVCALAENAIGSASYKPGDVIKGYAGKTVEVANTDAEGRLVLADAISYVIKNYRPARLVDIATLTGACIVALGHDYTGLVSTDDDLAEALLASACRTDDRVWRLPSYKELRDSVKSKVADIRNLGLPKGAAGTITAAEFLRQFAEADGTRWAHLDIAGTAFVEGDQRMYFAHGATGAGVRLLTDFLLHS